MSLDLATELMPSPVSTEVDRLVLRRPYRRGQSLRTPRNARAKKMRRSVRQTRGVRYEVISRPPVLIVRRRYQAVKRWFDVLLCLAAMPLVLPILAICALAIWITDPGPILFTQVRTGKGGRRFRMYKFRTMLRNAEELEQKYAHLNKLKWPDFKISDDPRVTRVGKILRRTSLDELPQLFNVLKGDMSLVGPRPTIFATDKYALWQLERLEVLPGITGLWQINGRSDIEFDDRLRLDIEYVQNQSIWLDLSILCRTFPAVVRQHGAY
jgi:lipopolysaccharide/colanic/teichoic acid biosynthesis glycosyltransferase